jgi:AAA domain
VNISAGLAFLKQKRVLLVDFDPQGNASMALGVDIENLRYSVKDLLTGAMTDLHYLCWDKDDNVSVTSFLDTCGPNMRLHPPRHTVAPVSPGQGLWSPADQAARSHGIGPATHAVPGGVLPRSHTL